MRRAKKRLTVLCALCLMVSLALPVQALEYTFSEREETPYGKSTSVEVVQTPDGGAIVPNGAEIILYMGAEKSSDRCIVPKVTNMSADEANRALVNAGLIMKATGSSASGAKVISQSLEPGTEADAGTVVTVQMGTMSNIAD